MAVAQPIVSGTPAVPLRLYLIRHGETEWSLASKHTSYTDLPLTEQGEEGARRLGQKLRASEFNRVFTSPSRRARSTCTLAELTPLPKSNPPWRSGTMASTKAGALWTFKTSGLTGIFFRTAVRKVNRPRRFAAALIYSSPVCADSMETWRFLHTVSLAAFWRCDGSDCR